MLVYTSGPGILEANGIQLPSHFQLRWLIVSQLSYWRSKQFNPHTHLCCSLWSSQLWLSQQMFHTIPNNPRHFWVFQLLLKGKCTLTNIIKLSFKRFRITFSVNYRDKRQFEIPIYYFRWQFINFNSTSLSSNRRIFIKH